MGNATVHHLPLTVGGKRSNKSKPLNFQGLNPSYIKKISFLNYLACMHADPKIMELQISFSNHAVSSKSCMHVYLKNCSNISLIGV